MATIGDVVKDTNTKLDDINVKLDGLAAAVAAIQVGTAPDLTPILDGIADIQASLKI